MNARAIAPQASLLVVALVAIAVVASLWPSFASMAGQWRTSSTFGYGFAIAPLAVALAWRVRHRLAAAAFVPSAWPLVAVIPASAVWWLGMALAIEVVHQAAAVACLVLAIWATIGTRAARVLAFPLGYLLLMVPVGETFVLPLMHLTAAFAVAAVQATGVPVYRDGFVFSLPSGDFEVIEACSGVRFLLAAVAAGAVFGYLAYRSWWKRCVFALACVAVPIVANLLRAWGVVMLVHWSDRRLAIGGQHDTIGLAFYFAVLAAFFALAARYADPAIPGTTASDGPTWPRPTAWWPAVVVLAVIAGGAVLRPSPPAAGLPEGAAVTASPPVLAGFAGPELVDPRSQPALPGAVATGQGIYRATATGLPVTMLRSVVGPATPTGGRPVATPEGGAVARAPEEQFPDAAEVNYGLLRSGEDRELLAWWYEVPSARTRSRVRAELGRVLAAASGDADARVSVVMLVTPITDDATASARRLAAFRQALLAARARQ